MPWRDHIATLDQAIAPDPARFGDRAAVLWSLAQAGLPVPNAVFLSVEAVRAIADGQGDEAVQLARALDEQLPPGALAIRGSPPQRDWGAPATLLNVGLDADRASCAELARFCCDYALLVDGVELSLRDPQSFDAIRADYAAQTGMTLPSERVTQLARSLVGFAGDWARLSAQVLRQARGAPLDAQLGIIVQEMISGVSGTVYETDPETGAVLFDGTWHDRAGNTGRVADLSPKLRDVLSECLGRSARLIKDEVRLTFGVAGADVQIFDAAPLRRSARAEMRIAVGLVDKGIISRHEALVRIDPRTLIHHLHPQIDGCEDQVLLGCGIAASPGAASGPLVFTADAAHRALAQEDRAILVRNETTPEDIRGMNSAAAVLTLTGGISSHAAVIAQGLGLPAVVGAGDLHLEGDQLVLPDGRRLVAGDVVTLDGSDGAVYDGRLPLRAADPSPAFLMLMAWADDVRQMGVRANADTPQEARTARRFGADGIGLCRTEHMFYAKDRLEVMQHMILAKDVHTRRAAIDQLLPMQRADFLEIFDIMEGRPVTIRLLDPPLHEFLPKQDDQIGDLARTMGLSTPETRQRIADLEEFNPMLGRRGVRLGVTMPEVYEMQARAIFEAAIASAAAGRPVQPEIMVPLVSAAREVELIKAQLEKIANEVAAETGVAPEYSVGVMVETPRAALRAGDLAARSSFLSFGTNDLTQMTYGLSRDDAGRFMRDYVSEDVFPEDPFLTLDEEAVGELLLTAAQRGRAQNPAISLGLCGEHGGDPASVRFCKFAGFDYVSCSPYRVPIARLAAAQATLLPK